MTTTDSEKPQVRIAHDHDEHVQQPTPELAGARSADEAIPTMPAVDPQEEIDHVASATDPASPRPWTSRERMKRLANVADGKMPSHVEITTAGMRYPDQLVYKNDGAFMFDDMYGNPDEDQDEYVDFDHDGIPDYIEKRHGKRARFWRNSQNYSYNHVGTIGNPRQNAAIHASEGNMWKSDPVMFDDLIKFEESQHPRGEHGRFSSAQAQTPVKAKAKPKIAVKISQAERLSRAMDWYNTEGKKLPEYQRKEGESSPKFARRIETQLHAKFEYNPLKAEYERRRNDQLQSKQETADWNQKEWGKRRVVVSKADMFEDLYKDAGQFDEQEHPRDSHGQFTHKGSGVSAQPHSEQSLIDRVSSAVAGHRTAVAEHHTDTHPDAVDQHEESWLSRNSGTVAAVAGGALALGAAGVAAAYALKHGQALKLAEEKLNGVLRNHTIQEAEAESSSKTLSAINNKSLLVDAEGDLETAAKKVNETSKKLEDATLKIHEFGNEKYSVSSWTKDRMKFSKETDSMVHELSEAEKNPIGIESDIAKLKDDIDKRTLFAIDMDNAAKKVESLTSSLNFMKTNFDREEAKFATAQTSYKKTLSDIGIVGAKGGVTIDAVKAAKKAATDKISSYEAASITREAEAKAARDEVGLARAEFGAEHGAHIDTFIDRNIRNDLSRGLPEHIQTKVTNIADHEAGQASVMSPSGRSTVRWDAFDSYRKAVKIAKDEGKNIFEQEASGLDAAQKTATGTAASLQSGMDLSAMASGLLDPKEKTVLHGIYTKLGKVRDFFIDPEKGIAWKAVASVGLLMTPMALGAGAILSDKIYNEVRDKLTEHTGVSIKAVTNYNTGEPKSVWLTKKDEKGNDVTSSFVTFDQNGNAQRVITDPKYDPAKDPQNQLQQQKMQQQINQPQGMAAGAKISGASLNTVIDNIKSAHTTGRLSSDAEKDAMLTRHDFNQGAFTDQSDRRKIVSEIGGYSDFSNPSNFKSYVQRRQNSGQYNGPGGAVAWSADMMRAQAFGGPTYHNDLKLYMRDLNKADIVMFDDALAKAQGPSLFFDLYKFDPQWDESEHPRNHGKFAHKDEMSTETKVALGVGAVAALAGAGAAGYLLGGRNVAHALEELATKHTAATAEAAAAADAKMAAAVGAAETKGFKAGQATVPRPQVVAAPGKGRGKGKGAAAPADQLMIPTEGISTVGVKDAKEIPLSALPKGSNGVVTLRDALERTDLKGKLSIPVGVDSSGNVVIHDLKKSPHLLIAGTSGSGKSVGMNNTMLSLAANNSPKDVRFAFIDPGNDLRSFHDLPHMIGGEAVAKTPEGAMNILSRLRNEKGLREAKFEEMSNKLGSKVNDIDSYNAVSSEKMPRIVLAADELSAITRKQSGLSEDVRDVINSALMDLSARGRKAGIHLILATQHPEAAVVEAGLRTNLGSALGFMTTDKRASTAIIGNGDAAMSSKGGLLSKPGELIYAGSGGQEKIAGIYTSDKDVEAAVKHISNLNKFEIAQFDILRKASFDESEHPRDKDGEFTHGSGASVPAKQGEFDGSGYSNSAGKRAHAKALDSGPEGSQEYLEAHHEAMMQFDPKYRSEHTQVIAEDRGKRRGEAMGTNYGAVALGGAGAALAALNPETGVGRVVGGGLGGAVGAFGHGIAGAAKGIMQGGGWLSALGSSAVEGAKGVAHGASRGWEVGASRPRLGSALALGIPLAVVGAAAGGAIGQRLGSIHDRQNTVRRVEKAEMFDDLMKTWDEEKHPRDHGQFASTEGPIERGASMFALGASGVGIDAAVARFLPGAGMVGTLASHLVGGTIASMGAAKLGEVADDHLGNAKGPEGTMGQTIGGLAGSMGGGFAGQKIAQIAVKGGGLKGLIAQMAGAGAGSMLGDMAGSAAGKRIG